jgi:hypothetical protein
MGWCRWVGRCSRWRVGLRWAGRVGRWWTRGAGCRGTGYQSPTIRLGAPLLILSSSRNSTTMLQQDPFAKPPLQWSHVESTHVLSRQWQAPRPGCQRSQCPGSEIKRTAQSLEVCRSTRMYKLAKTAGLCCMLGWLVYRHPFAQGPLTAPHTTFRGPVPRGGRGSESCRRSRAGGGGSLHQPACHCGCMAPVTKNTAASTSLMPDVYNTLPCRPVTEQLQVTHLPSDHTPCMS